MKIPCPVCGTGVVYSSFSVPACKECQKMFDGLPLQPTQAESSRWEMAFKKLNRAAWTPRALRTNP